MKEIVKWDNEYRHLSIRAADHHLVQVGSGHLGPIT